MTVLRPAARAIVIKDGCLLVMCRRRPDGRQYMVTPGGRLEPDEDPIQTVHRELAEETMVTVKNPRLVFVEEPNDDRWGTQHIYLCEYVSGEPQLHPDSEEQQDNDTSDNHYEPMWYPVANLPSNDFPFRSERLGNEILYAIANGFPDEPKRWILDPPVVK